MSASVFFHGTREKSQQEVGIETPLKDVFEGEKKHGGIESREVKD